MDHLRARWVVWLEAVLCLASLILAIGTLVVHDWMEVILGIETDGGNGANEALVTILMVAATVAFGLAARLEWGRSRTSQAG
jgi:hypothetical protein